MWLFVNAEPQEYLEDLTLDQFILVLNLSRERIAVELNGKVIRRVDWATTKLENNDRLEIVHFVGGG